jgi:hypothetical protein
MKEMEMGEILAMAFDEMVVNIFNSENLKINQTTETKEFEDV